MDTFDTGIEQHPELVTEKSACKCAGLGSSRGVGVGCGYRVLGSSNTYHWDPSYAVFFHCAGLVVGRLFDSMLVH